MPKHGRRDSGRASHSAISYPECAINIAAIDKVGRGTSMIV